MSQKDTNMSRNPKIADCGTGSNYAQLPSRLKRALFVSALMLSVSAIVVAQSVSDTKLAKVPQMTATPLVEPGEFAGEYVAGTGFYHVQYEQSGQQTSSGQQPGAPQPSAA